MYDAVLGFIALSEVKSTLLASLNIALNDYFLATDIVPPIPIASKIYAPSFVGANKKKILNPVNDGTTPKERPSIYGDGHAAEKIARILGCFFDGEIL